MDDIIPKIICKCSSQLFSFQFDDFRPRSFTEPFEHTEGLKDILPRHLRKPFRLLNEVNSNKDLPILALELFPQANKDKDKDKDKTCPS